MTKSGFAKEMKRIMAEEGSNIIFEIFAELVGEDLATYGITERETRSRINHYVQNFKTILKERLEN